MGQLFSDSSVVIPATPALPLRLGRETEGGLVVHLRAAKYKQSAGPDKKRKLVEYRSSELCFVRFSDPLTRYHKVRFCAAEQLGVDQPLNLGLGEGRLEVRVETVLNELFR